MRESTLSEGNGKIAAYKKSHKRAIAWTRVKLGKVVRSDVELVVICSVHKYLPILTLHHAIVTMSIVVPDNTLTYSTPFSLMDRICISFTISKNFSRVRKETISFEKAFV